MLTDHGYRTWRYRAVRSGTAHVLPDGCRDILIVRRPREPDRIALTPFDFSPRHAVLAEGTEVIGYRLRPGTLVGRDVLAVIAADQGAADAILGETTAGASESSDVIRALAAAWATAQSVARASGVSVRTLQRHFSHLGLPPPEYWRLLGRARRAACLLAPSMPLAAIAGDCGYSDQAHMTREFVRWFGRTPHRLRRDARLLDILRQPGLGNWTGEQISTR